MIKEYGQRREPILAAIQFNDTPNETIVIRSDIDNVFMNKGDFLLKGILNDFYSIKEDEFNKFYEEVKE